MNILEDIHFLLHITRTRAIARRYFVVNGFDGALTMLGLAMGFYVSDNVDLGVAVSACFGAAVALGMSGLSSAYISESAEREKALRDLEEAMITDLKESAHGRAARLVPLLIALVNGAAPMLISLVIISPLWLAYLGMDLPVGPIEAAIALAFLAIFLLGSFLGQVTGRMWAASGLRALLVGLATALIIFWIGN